MNNIPNTEKRSINVRSITSSKEQNKFEEQVLSDILELYNKANILEIELDNMEDIIGIEKMYTDISLHSLESKMATIIQDLYNKNLSKKIMYIYPSDIKEFNPKSQISVNLDTNDITFTPSKTESKVNIYDEISENIFIPDSLKVELLTENKPGILDIIDNDVYKAFDKKPSSTWIRKIITDNTVSEVTTTMNIYLPYDTITSDYVNEVVIKPFPSNSIDIVDIKYSSTYDISYTNTLEELNSHSKCPLYQYNNVFNESTINGLNSVYGLRLNFKDKSIKVLSVTFKQRNSIATEHGRVFYIGARDIEINQNKYDVDTSNLVYYIDFNDNNESHTIYSISNVTNNKDIISSESFFSISDNGAETHISDSTPFTTTSKKIKVVSTITKSETPPSINKIKIEFK